jgi:cytochrome P450
MTSTTPEPPRVGDWFDPATPEFVLRPRENVARARREAAGQPLRARISGTERTAYVLTAYGDIVAALQDSATFSSARAFPGVDVPDHLKGLVPETVMGDSLIASDPPKHTKARRVSNLGFRRSVVAELEPAIRARANALIDGFEDRGNCDLLADFSLALTFTTLTSLLGLPETDIPRLMQTVVDHATILLVGRPTAKLSPQDYEAAWSRWMEVRAYLRGLVDIRAEDPAADLISTFVSARDEDGEPILPPEEIVTHLSAIVTAGADTTASTIANTVILLTRFPRVRDELLESPELWPNAVEESMRLLPTLAGSYRVTTTDARLPSGAVIPADSAVYLSAVAGNHDDKRFPEPERFDLHRADLSSHLSLGTGRHVCLGAPLGRLQARVALQALYERLPTLHLAPGEATEYVPFALTSNERALNVVWEPSAATDHGAVA